MKKTILVALCFLLLAAFVYDNVWGTRCYRRSIYPKGSTTLFSTDPDTIVDTETLLSKKVDCVGITSDGVECTASSVILWFNCEQIDDSLMIYLYGYNSAGDSVCIDTLSNETVISKGLKSLESSATPFMYPWIKVYVDDPDDGAEETTIIKDCYLELLWE